ncbi:MAG: putative membrane protein [Cenarchaeum symbiont of Oopsacas minuta]|nr:putative membrane protein [Cenarchaeum symbiont of Oopsacas minuta]
MNQIEQVIQWVTGLINEETLYFGIFVASLIETVFPPIPTLAIFPLAGFVASQSGIDVFGTVLLGIIGGIGASIGSTVIYVVSWKLGRKIVLQYLRRIRIQESSIIRAERWFRKYGDKIVLFGRMLPIMREMVSIPAGILKMHPLKFLIYTFTGSCVWSIGTIFAGYYFGAAVFSNP